MNGQIKRIIGLHFTHDAGIAVLNSEGKLLFAAEAEKFDNAPRYAKVDSLQQMQRLFAAAEYEPNLETDIICVDGWKGGRIPAPWNLPVAPYHKGDKEWTGHPERQALPFPYTSVHHAHGHAYGAYMTAPFAGDEDAACLVWDGGMRPHLYLTDIKKSSTLIEANCFGKLGGSIYGIMGLYAGPFANPSIRSGALRPNAADKLYAAYDIPGKLMSYIGLGASRKDLVMKVVGVYEGMTVPSSLEEPLSDGRNEHAFMLQVMEELKGESDPDILLAVHDALEWLLVHEIAQGASAIRRNLCFSGGSALNIKWNSALRESGLFDCVWVPPFPNDSGSAIGAAAAVLYEGMGVKKLDWNVYCGPSIKQPPASEGWSRIPCTAEQLGRILVDHPVVVLTGRAEIGPRALGHRSIFANPAKIENKDLLNGFKKRESWRPVAPICLEQFAPILFDPGIPDPYMLFDHKVKRSRINALAAVVHVDQTARLQTVGKDGCPIVRRILNSFWEATNIPALCNTSANFNGSGFFPDVESAQRWGMVDHIWSNGMLYVKDSK